MSKDSCYRIGLILVLLLAFFLRLRTLDFGPLWFDELMEYWVATAPLDSLLPTVRASLQDPPLYSLLLHFWMQLGRDEFTLRLLSAFASILSVATLSKLGLMAQGRAAALFSAIILAVLPPDIRFAQEAGQYALMIFLLTLNLLAMTTARKTNRWRDWSVWVISGLLSIYNYYGALIPVGAVAGWVFVESLLSKRTSHLGRQSLAGGVFLLFGSPLLIDWIPNQLFRGSTSGAFQFTLGSLSTEWTVLVSGTRRVLSYQLTGYIADPASLPTLQFAALVSVVVMLLACLYGLTRTRRHAYLLGWLLISWVVYYAAGRIGAYPYGGSRHALILTPLLTVSVGIGAAMLWNRHRALGIAGLLAILIVTAAAPREAPQDMRTVVTQYLARRQASTPTYVYYGAVPGYRYQVALAMDTEEKVPGAWYRDCWAGKPTPYCAEEGVFYGRWIRQLPPEDKAAQILSTLGDSNAEYWIIFSHTAQPEQDDLLGVLRQSHIEVESIVAVGASAYLLRAESQSP